MTQDNFQLGEIVKEKRRDIPMKITYILPAKDSDNDYTCINKYVCEWFERGRQMTRICQGTDLEYLKQVKKQRVI
jgi:hypothetical protein